MDTGQHIEYDGLRRAARLAASIAGAAGVDADEIAEEALARLLLQDSLVNNPKAWVRSTATRMVARGDRLGISTDEVLADLGAVERSLVVGQRSGYMPHELAARHGLSEDAVHALLHEANRKIRRSGRRLAGAGN